MKKLGSKVLNVALSGVLVCGLLPASAGAEESSLAEEATSPLAAQSALEAQATVTSGWTQSGTAEWQIASDGTLSIRPLGGGTSGALEAWQDYDYVPWYSQREDITSVVVTGTVTAPDCSYMFQGCSNLKTANLSNLDTSQCSGMTQMFRGCSSLESVNLSGWNTSRVQDMSGMFYRCSSLTSLDLSGFNTSNVEVMANMFDGCTALTSLNISSFNTAKVKNMQFMFEDCSSLPASCISVLNTSSATGLKMIFYGCKQIAAQTRMSLMNAYLATNGGLSTDWTSGLFGECPDTSISTAALSGKSSTYPYLDTTNATDFSDMFANCPNLTTLDVSTLNTSHATNMFYMFRGCYVLEGLDLSSFDTSHVTNMMMMFTDCWALKTLDVTSFDTAAVTNMKYMFTNCNKLTLLDVTSFDTRKVTGAEYMFSTCSSLITIYASPLFSLDNAETTDDMFVDCKRLVGGSGTAYDGAYTNKDYARIDGGSENPGYFTRGRQKYMGDVNKNGVINIVDAQLAYDIAQKNIPESFEDYAGMKERADVTGDSEV